MCGPEEALFDKKKTIQHRTVYRWADLQRKSPQRNLFRWRASLQDGGVCGQFPSTLSFSQGLTEELCHCAFKEHWWMASIAAVLAMGWQGVWAGPPGAELKVPVEYYKLPNGLRVVLSQDHTAPTVCVAVYYRIGFRVEPRDRTGFAHLFEHMMFQGSQNLGKMEFIKLVQQNGGVLNGSTRFDFTNYFEILPSNKLETALWAEADRMGGLAVTEDNLKNQQGVVGNEVKGAVINTPYGGFPWLDMPQYANTNWYNAHNFYGELKDIEAATLPEVQSFFKTYYAPNNAALAIVGDFDPVQARQMVEKYFGGIKQSQLPAVPDLAEHQQEKEKRASKVDELAQRPAIGIAYHIPERNTSEYYAMGSDRSDPD
jgi:predicted Zn-dependent peptidase